MLDAVTTEQDLPVSELRARHVLVPIDGSEFSLQAFPTARELARRLKAELHSISVATGEDDADRLRALAAASLGVDPDDERVHVATGDDPSEEIVRRADELGDTVVCLTTHGRGRMHGAVVGSVTRSVLQLSPHPIVALGPMADNPGWSPRPRAWPEPLTVPRLVACVDGSDTSEQVIPVAVAWARALDMSLTLLTAIEDAPEPLRPEQHRSRYGKGVSPESYVDALVQRWSGALADIDGEVIRDPVGVAGAIRTHLDQRPASLVALTTHARSGLQRVLLGAQAAHIIHASVTPCIVVPLER